MANPATARLESGALTRRYIHGERARFVSPLALFLFSVFLMFAVFGSIGGRSMTCAAISIPLRPAISARPPRRSEHGSPVWSKRRTATPGAAVSSLDARLVEARRELAAIETARSLAEGTSGGVIAERLNIDLVSSALDARVRKALGDPQLLLYKLQNSAYKFAWALIPLSLPFMALIFAWRRQYRMYDHAVFVTYSLSAVILLLVAMAFVAATGIGVDWALLLIPAHFFVQLKGAYALSNASAAWRSAALLVFSTMVMLVFAALLLVLGVLG